MHSQFVLHGNIRDRYLAQRRHGGNLVETDRSLPESLWAGLRRLGYGALLSYDQITGFVALGGPDQDTVVELLNDALRSPRRGQTGGRTPNSWRRNRCCGRSSPGSRTAVPGSAGTDGRPNRCGWRC